MKKLGRFFHARRIMCRWLPNLSQAQMATFEVIAEHWNYGEELTVTRLMEQDWIASPASMHRNMLALIDAGIVQTVTKHKNRRTKYLRVTKKGQSILETFERLLEEQ